MSLAERLARRLIWAWHAVKAWLPATLGALANLAAIVWASFGDAVWGAGVAWFVVAVVLSIGALLAQFVIQRPSYMELARQKEVAEASSRDKTAAIDQALTVLIRKLASHCAIDSNDDRVSVYYFHNDTFVRLSRWSAHPVYRLPGRPYYPANQGAIGRAWDDVSVVTNLPASRQAWEQRLETKHEFEQGTASQLNMHCRSIAALRIDTPEQPVGVIVFESTKNHATQEVIDKASESMLFAALTELVGVAARHTSQVADATRQRQPRPQRLEPEWKSVAKTSG